MEHISTTLIIPIIMILFVVIPFVFIFLSVRRKITFVKEIKFGTVSDFRFIELDKEIYTELTIKNNVFLVYGDTPRPGGRGFFSDMHFCLIRT